MNIKIVLKNLRQRKKYFRDALAETEKRIDQLKSQHKEKRQTFTVENRIELKKTSGEYAKDIITTHLKEGMKDQQISDVLIAKALSAKIHLPIATIRKRAISNIRSIKSKLKRKKHAKTNPRASQGAMVDASRPKLRRASLKVYL